MLLMLTSLLPIFDSFGINLCGSCCVSLHLLELSPFLYVQAEICLVLDDFFMILGGGK